MEPRHRTKWEAMRSESGRAEDVTDVKIRPPRQNQWPKAAAVAGCVVLAVFAVWWWLGPYQSWRDRNEVETALALVDKRGGLSTSLRTERAALEKNPPSTRLYLLHEFLAKYSSQDHKDVFRSAGAAALREAARQGHALAAFEWWKLRRSTEQENLKQLADDLDQLVKRVQMGAKVGDAVSMLALSRMTREGVGVSRDEDAAIELVERAAPNLPPGMKAKLIDSAAWGTKDFEGQANERLADELAQQLFDQKYFADKSIPCSLLTDRYAVCARDWVEKYAVAGNENYFADHARNVFLAGSFHDALRWYKKTPEDTIFPNNELFYSFLELILGSEGEVPVRLYKYLGDRSSVSPSDRVWHTSDYAQPRLAEILRTTDSRQMRNYLQAVVILRALAVYEDSSLPRDGSRAWQMALSDPEGQAASGALLNALQSRNGINAALKRIAMLGQHAQTLRPVAQQAEAARAKPEAADPDFRARSGPLDSAGSAKGLSSFTVDNTQGSHDVVVRLYRDGARPALRSFLVKKGDVYTSEKIPAGSYVMRHRHIGSDKTYEANEVFELKETAVEGGTRYSRVRVTMYSVRDGNLTNREVPPENF